MLMVTLIGRQREKQILQSVLDAPEAEFVCVYGRRRIGKTFLIRQFFAKELCFELTGVFDATLKEQLHNFTRAFNTAFGHAISPPSDWQTVFALLGDALLCLPKSSAKRVVFLDELPWLSSRRSGFLR